MRIALTVILGFCCWYNAFSQQQQWPHKEYAYAEACLYNLKGKLHGDHTILKNNKLDNTVFGNPVRLSERQTGDLLEIVNGDYLELMQGLSECYIPHHGIVFYNEYARPVASMTICFHCEAFRLHPVLPSFVDYKPPEKKISDERMDTLQRAIQKLESVMMEASLPVFNSPEAYRNYESQMSAFMNTGTDHPFFLKGNIIRSSITDPNDPNVIYCGYKDTIPGSGLVVRSKDLGRTWEVLNNGYPIGTEVEDIQTLAVSSTDNNLLFAGTWKNGLYRSSNGGNSWSKVESCPASDVRSIAIGKIDPDLLYAGTGSKGVITSSDGGKTWEEYDSIMWKGTFRFVWKVAVDPNNNDIAYVATHSGCFKTTDRGKSWQLIFTPPEKNCWDIAISPEDNKRLWLAATDNKTTGHIYFSTDGGLHWKPLDGLPEAYWCKISQSYTDPNLLYAGSRNEGLYRSKDKGANWEKYSHPLPDKSVSGIHPLKHHLIVATWGNGVAVYQNETPKMIGGDQFEEFDRMMVTAVGNYELLNLSKHPDSEPVYGSRVGIRLRDGRYVLLETHDLGKREQTEIEQYLGKRIQVSGIFYKMCNAWGDGDEATIIAPCLQSLEGLKLVK